MSIDVVKFLLLPLRIFVALGLASGLIMFLPDKIISTLCLNVIKQNWSPALGIIFIISLSMFIVFIAGEFWKSIKRWYNFIMLKRSQYKFLKRLPQEKVEFIKMFIAAPGHTIPLPYQNGIVLEMTHHHVISPAGNTHLINPLNPTMKYFLQPWVIDRIQDHQCLCEMYKVDSIEEIMENPYA